MNDHKVFTPLEIAEILKISKGTVYELVKRGEIDSYKVGNKVRIEEAALEQYMNKAKKIQKVNKEDIEEIPTIEEKNKNVGMVICGQDIMLDILARHLQQLPKSIQALRSYTGSYNGLYALYHGEVQIATAHLWDGETDEYNISYVKRMLPGTPAMVIHLANRMQGIYVAKGNPKHIEGILDLKRKDINIVNREKGSGTRILLDEYLKKYKINIKSLKGYHKECSSHLAAASIVSRGEVDFALGNEKAAQQVSGIDFIPFQSESYDLIIKQSDFYQEDFQSVIKILRSSEFKQELEGIGGYELTNLGKIIAET